MSVLESPASSAPSPSDWSIGANPTASISGAVTPLTVNDNMSLESLIQAYDLPTPRLASEVTTMAEVRVGIDQLDEAIVTLLGTRMRFIEAAARIKPSRDVVRDQWRVNDVIQKCQKTAERVNFPPKLVAEVYGVLVEGSIMHEFTKWDEHREGGVVEPAKGEANKTKDA